ncbi:MAG: histidine phosphatase family protein [Spirochaetales bacterium]|nr:histidine phosphatase family protein [Spirochaetales bacterium]
MIQLYLVRHGETELNEQDLLQGRKDLPLSEKGREQAVRLKNRLKEVPLDRIYSSPMKQTIFTALEIADERNLPVRIKDKLMEFDFGDWEGRTIGELEKEEPRHFHTFRFAPEEFRGENGGETYAQLFFRARAFLNEIEREGQNILIVSHSFMIKALLILLQNQPLGCIWTPPIILPASLTHLRKNGKGYEFSLGGDCTPWEEREPCPRPEWEKIMKKREAVR